MPTRKTKSFLLTRAPTSASTRSAWSHRNQLLECVPSEPLHARFIELAREHCHETYREPHTAVDLRVGVRHMTRLVTRWFGYSPRVVVGLIRVESVARGLITSRRAMKELAAEHGYPSRQAMNRHFRAYTGVLPAAFRKRVTQSVMSGNDPQKSENGLSPEARNDRMDKSTSQLAASTLVEEDRRDESTAKSLPVSQSRPDAVRTRKHS